MQRITIISTCHFTRYHTFSLSLPWFGAICTRYRQIYKKYMLIVFLKNDGNALQVSQNQANLRENIW